MVVIVVIGILAGLVTVGTGKYQSNARNQSKIVATQGLSSSLRTYLAEFNKYPMEDNTCLGYGDDYSNNGDVCQFTSTDGGENFTPNTQYQVRNSFNKALAKVTTDPRPKINTSKLGGDLGFTGADVYIAGVVFTMTKPQPSTPGDAGKYYVVKGGLTSTYDHWYYVKYLLEGENVDCGVSVVEYKPGDVNNYYNTDKNYSYSVNGITLCVHPLPDPKNPDSPIN